MSSETATVDSDDVEDVKVLTEYGDHQSWELRLRDFWFEHDHLMLEFPSGRVEAVCGDGAFVSRVDIDNDRYN